MVLPGGREIPVDFIEAVGEAELKNLVLVDLEKQVVGIQVVDCENIVFLEQRFSVLLIGRTQRDL